MAGRKRQTYFQEDWKEKPEFAYIRQGSCRTEAYCELCKKTFQLISMGVGALSSHIKPGTKHSKKLQEIAKSSDIRMFASPPATANQTSAPRRGGPGGGFDDNNPDEPAVMHPDDHPTTGSAASGSANARASGSASAPASGSATAPASGSALSDADFSRRLDKYLSKDDVTKAEILWCLQSIENHVSINATGKQVSIFPLMFPDSKIATSMHLGATKVSYGLVHGLAPHFHQNIISLIRESGAFVAMFDESLNKMTQKQQMDIAIRFWNSDSDQVESHYFSSAFLERARAQDMMGAFNNELKSKLDFNNLLQISMDGPNVNWSFVKELEADIRHTSGDSCPLFINMGSCGLHNVHNCFKEGAKCTQWNVVQFLRSCYYVFKDVPARRSHYIRFNAPDKPPLPKKFCSVRWLENEEVANVAQKIIPNLKNFVQGCKEEKIKIVSKTFKFVVNALDDCMLPAKLAFFGYAASQVSGFLTKYQCEAPMSPFLYHDLTAMIRDLMSIFVVKDVLDKAKSVCDVDLKIEANLIQSSKINLGHAVRSELKKLSQSADKIKTFRDECRSFLVTMTSYLLKKSPLQYSVCKAITFCDPSLIASQTSVSKSRLTSALETFSSRNWVSSKLCDKIEKEFKALTSSKEFLALCKEYKREVQRVDHFWRDVLKETEYKSLYQFLKKVLIMSHGQAFVERGFSINKEMVVENQLEKSLVSQRQIYNAIKTAGGILKTNIDKKMILWFRNARDRYGDYLDKRKKEREESLTNDAKRRSLCQQLSELKAKKAKMVADSISKVVAVDDEIAALQARIR